MWHVNCLIYLNVLFGILHLCSIRYTLASSRYDDCTLHTERRIWYSAKGTCKRENKILLCYESKEVVESILDKHHLTEPNTKYALWLSSPKCKVPQKYTDCLILNLDRGNGDVQHLFGRSCFDRLPFICCPPFKEVTTAETVETFQPHTSTETSISFSSSTSSLSTVWSSASSSKTLNTTLRTTYTTSVITSSSSTHLSTSSELTTLIFFCESTRKRGIDWPRTHCGANAIEPCPGNSIGTATWYCLNGTSCLNFGSSSWDFQGPDMSNCYSKDLKELKEKFNSITAKEAVELLDKIFEDEENLQGKDLLDSTQLISNLPEKLFSEIQHLPDEIRYEAATKAVNKMASIFDKLIASEVWSDISEESMTTIGSQILSSVDSFGLLLAGTMNDEITEHSIVKENMMLEVIKPKDVNTVIFPRNSEGYTKFTKTGMIKLHEGYLNQLDHENNDASIIYTFYNEINNILDVKNRAGILNSPVVSVSIGQKQSLQPKSIKATVHISVKNVNESAINDSTCVFWNLNKNTWDNFGCKLLEFNTSHSLCECDHLTNFAVLMDFQGILDDEDSRILVLITIIGCSISIICLTICIVIFTFYRLQHRNAYSIRYSIHRNLCITLCLANVLLISGLDQTENKITCGIIAGFLHYFFLSAFSWMLLEGVHIYFLLVVVFASKKTHWKKYYSFGYGFPLIIVGITALCSSESYGTPDRCWLSTENGAIWSFTGPVACILFINLAALILAQWKANKISVKKDGGSMVKSWLRVTFILFPILGITWLLGFLFVGKNAKIMIYLFAVLNSLQGLCIFICHCAMDKKVRTMVSTSIRKKTVTIHGGSSDSKRVIKRGSSARSTDIEEPESLTKILRDKCMNKWHQISKPWSFCFTLEVSNRRTSSLYEDNDNIPIPAIVNCNTTETKQ